MYKFLFTAFLALSSLNAVEVKEEMAVPYIAYEIKMGEHFDTIQGQCLTCHSFGYIINQGPQSKAFWSGKVKKMENAFGMDISKKDASSVVDYLFKHYGNGKLK
ncbi:sulfite:cytochrome C oxidoreductase subunit B [Sulfurimonas sp. MAG313]|nr:sulfite:cytochrome C oxidoreductase subunit B [Sulfurimonas sp. MAG313]MDF1880996.1 sulfite:cytochrome C oxidoreductase subunit B [Sulfurimonas sp. MAG313]